MAALHRLAVERGYTDWTGLVRAQKASPVNGSAPKTNDAHLATAYERTIEELEVDAPPSSREVLDALRAARAKNRFFSGASRLSENISTRSNRVSAEAVAAMIAVAECNRQRVDLGFGHTSYDLSKFNLAVTYWTGYDRKEDRHARIQTLLRELRQ